MMYLKENVLLQNGKYKIEKVLGQGGFGITYLATQSILDRKVCIKEFFFKEYCTRNNSSNYVEVCIPGNDEIVQRYMSKFLKEARTISHLDHPNIIRIHDIFTENNTAYYVMEYISGVSLSDKVAKEGALQESEAIIYIRQIANALDCIHQRKINHLDVKPANIMIREYDGEAILIDFGLAKQYDNHGGETSTTPVGISHGYAPMEQYKQGGVNTFSPQTDIYALGATLYKLLTGKTPPQAIDILDEGLPQLPSNLSREVIGFIQKAMQPHKTNRPNTIRDLFDNMTDKVSVKNITVDAKQSIGEETTLVGDVKITSKKISQFNLVTWIMILFLFFGVCVCFYYLYTTKLSPSIEDTTLQTNKIVNTYNTDSYGICTSKVVDLGLSVNWAGWNVGASATDEYGGLYYIDRIPKNGWDNSWRLPTEAEQSELKKLCKWEWMAYKNGVYGIKVTGPNGNAIFLPAAGIRDDDNTIIHRNIYGSYWSSDKSSSTTGGNYFMEFDDFDGKTDDTGFPLMAYGYYRYLDKSVRLVSDR